GLIDAFWVLITRSMNPQSSNNPSNFQSEEFDFEDYISPLKWPPPQQERGKKDKTVGSWGGIDFIGAGRQGATYSERVNTFDWKRFYELGGRLFLDNARTQLASTYDYILIDSRTGVSDTAGICTMQMPDIL